MKGLEFSTTITVILVLIVLSIALIYTSDFYGKAKKPLEDIQIKKICSHFECNSGCCDEDGGKNYMKQGCIKNQTHVFRDVCCDALGSVGSTHVKEYYCDGNKIKFEIHKCGAVGCLGGACNG